MGTPNNAVTQAAILAAVELVVAAECARAKVLVDGGDIEDENLAARATRRVKPNRETRLPSLAEHLARKVREPTKRRQS
jgi:hypothetical protein